MSQERNDNRSLKALWELRSYLVPFKGRLLLAGVLMLVGAVGAVLFPYTAKIAIDVYIAAHQARALVVFIVLVGVMMLLVNSANMVRMRIMASVGQEAVRRIRLDLFRHLQKLPVAYFDRMPVGKIMTRLTSDVDALAELLSGIIIQMVGDFLTLIGFLVFMLIIDWRLALVVMLGLPPLLFIFTFLSGRINRAEDEVRERASVVNAVLQEDVSGIKVIKAFQAGQEFTGRFETANQSLLRASLHAIFVFAFFWPIVDFTWVAGAGLTLLIGGGWVVKGTLTLGTLAAFMSYGGQFFGPLHGLSQAYRVIQRALAGAVRIRRIFAVEIEHISAADAMPPIEGRVEFRGVTFGYERERPVLKSIDLAARPGEMVALVGQTGAGKTSMINLLTRFYTPQEGAIFVDGLDINRFDLESYRRQVAVVLQEPFLFSGTVRDNLRYGGVEATEAEMLNALAAAGLRQVDQEEGIDLDLVLHERGGNLSAGQRQLLSFARALLADPRIIILDEATAHVDTITERRVQAAMARLLRGRTAFVIAHRLSTIQAADQILVLENGRIVERGSHIELLAKEGRYWRLCREQNIFTHGILDDDDELAAGE